MRAAPFFLSCSKYCSMDAPVSGYGRRAAPSHLCTGREGWDGRSLPLPTIGAAARSVQHGVCRQLACSQDGGQATKCGSRLRVLRVGGTDIRSLLRRDGRPKIPSPSHLQRSMDSAQVLSLVGEAPAVGRMSVHNLSSRWPELRSCRAVALAPPLKVFCLLRMQKGG